VVLAVKMFFGMTSKGRRDTTKSTQEGHKTSWQLAVQHSKSQAIASRFSLFASCYEARACTGGARGDPGE
jgi:hypothetical protein